MYKKHNYIITGSCGAGKTTIIEYISRTYPVVDEKFREVGREMQHPDEPKFHIHDGEKFQKEVLKRAIKSYHENGHEICFFDRGIPDGLVVLPYNHGIEPVDAWERMSNELRYNTSVFLLDMLPEDCFVKTRHPIPFDKSHELQKLLGERYNDLGYDIVEVPVDTVEKRAEFILGEVND